MTADKPAFDRAEYQKTYRQTYKSRVRRVNVTLDPDEHARLSVAAAARGEPVAAHLKRLAFAQLDARPLVTPETQARFDELVRILRGVGNNLNQIARHCNETRRYVDSREVQLNVRYLEDLVRQFIHRPERAHDHQKHEPENGQL